MKKKDLSWSDRLKSIGWMLGVTEVLLDDLVDSLQSAVFREVSRVD